VASSISAKRQRQMLAVLLGAFAVLTAASIATFRAPLPGEPPWATLNACGPVGALLSYGVIWLFGRVAAFGVPLLAALWGWNRLRGKPALPLVVTSAMGALLVFEICTLFGLGGLDRERWAGGWGFAATLALQSSLGMVGSWIVATALLFVTALAASEMGFHWIGKLAHGLVLNPARGVAGGVVGAWGQWQERRGPPAALIAFAFASASSARLR